MTEAEQPPQNGIDLSANEDEDSSRVRPADIEQDMREMERRKRVEAIMSSKLFREELERIVDSARDAGNSGSILQQLSDIVGLPTSRVGSVYKASNCMIPINDIRGVESMGYAKGEKILRCKLASTFRLLDLYGWTQGLGAQITARLKVDQEYFLVNPYGLLYHEITASSLNKVDMQGHIVEQGTTNFGVNKSHFVLHSVVHAARPDLRCAIYIGCSPVVAVSSLKTGLLPITNDACVLGDIATHHYTGTLLIDAEERDRLVRNLGPNSKVLLLTNHGALCCGETIEEAFHAASHIVQACETQLKLLPVGLENLSLIPEETRKVIYEQSRRPPEDLAKKFAATGLDTKEEIDGAPDSSTATANKIGAAPKWRVGGAEFEALMRMLDNAGYRTGYIYRHPLIKSDPPKPKNDVELPPAVSSLGYLLEEEDNIRQGIWKKGGFAGKGGDRSKWLNSPNVYQRVEVLETGTPDPKKITKWVADGSPTHSTPVRIDDAMQFVPAGTNPKEFKRLQQQIKDNRRADKISAGPQSHILEGVTWDEASRIKDASVSLAGDHVVLMGAASKGIIQRGFQHNATVYKAPYAKNPFDNVTDDELNEYKRTVERKKKSIHGEYTDTDFSESEALSSLQAGAQKHIKTVTQSEPEDIAEHQVMRIETQQAPVPSQPEVVLSDDFLHANHRTKIHREIAHNLQQQNGFKEKYAFLYAHAKPKSLVNCKNYNFICFMIHKIEIFPHYTYPLAANSNTNGNNSRDSAAAVLTNSNCIYADGGGIGHPTPLPYRTFSHYGFNYPLHCAPTIALHPPQLLSAVALQRWKIIQFINSTALNFVENVDATFVNKQRLQRQQQQQQADSHSGSFISMKEIQLQPSVSSRSCSRKPTCSDNSQGCQSNASADEHDQHSRQQHQQQQQQHGYVSSEPFSSSLCSSQHSVEYHDTPPHDVDDDKLYRSYVLRNFMPPINRLFQCAKQSCACAIDEHKPESERAQTVTMLKSEQPEEHANVTAKVKAMQKTATTAANTQTPLKTLEIHINVTIKNSDGLLHEQEFQTKLEKVIDHEIKLISQQLAATAAPSTTTAQQQQEQQANENCKTLQLSTIARRRRHRCSSSNDADYHATMLKTSTSTCAAVENAANASFSETAAAARYRHTLILLENELENLLNDIIRANELHNRTIMCDCKTKIAQISEDIKSSLNAIKIDD